MDTYTRAVSGPAAEVRRDAAAVGMAGRLPEQELCAAVSDRRPGVGGGS